MTTRFYLLTLAPNRDSLSRSPERSEGASEGSQLLKSEMLTALAHDTANGELLKSSYKKISEFLKNSGVFALHKSLALH